MRKRFSLRNTIAIFLSHVNFFQNFHPRDSPEKKEKFITEAHQIQAKLEQIRTFDIPNRAWYFESENANPGKNSC